MKTLLFSAIICLTMVSCVDPGLNFERMSETELAAYNQTRTLAQMMVCSEEARSFSRVRIRRCYTVEQMYGSVEQADQLGVLNTVQGYVGGEF